MAPHSGQSWCSLQIVPGNSHISYPLDIIPCLIIVPMQQQNIPYKEGNIMCSDELNTGITMSSSITMLYNTHRFPLFIMGAYCNQYHLMND